MKTFICLLIACYRAVVSPMLHWLGGPGCGCRFEPSCSLYLQEAVCRHGAASGLWMGLKRILRCHPWGSCGWDPVPSGTKEIRPTH